MGPSPLEPPPPPAAGGPLPPPPPPPPGYQYQQQGYGYTYGPAIGAYSGFWRRFLGYVLDTIVLGVADSILNNLGDAGPFLSLAAGVLYFSLLEGGPRGQTIGGMAVGVRVCDADTGGPIGYGRGVGRYFARILSALPLFLGYFWMLWDPRKQTWQDKLVRSVVVRTNV
jgi:uncharacterized RDD family membrane protein YckC